MTISTDDFLAQARLNPTNDLLLKRLPGLSLPQCMLTAGCLFQTISARRVNFIARFPSRATGRYRTTAIDQATADTASGANRSLNSPDRGKLCRCVREGGIERRRLLRDKSRPPGTAPLEVTLSTGLLL